MAEKALLCFAEINNFNHRSAVLPLVTFGCQVWTTGHWFENIFE